MLKVICVVWNSDLLFNQLYPRLVENTTAKGVFLESLESYIVTNRLCHLTTPIMKDLLAHYHDSGMMDSLERCIVHLDVTNLDIQQVNACIGRPVNKPTATMQRVCIYKIKRFISIFFSFLPINQ